LPPVGSRVVVALVRAPGRALEQICMMVPWSGSAGMRLIAQIEADHGVIPAVAARERLPVSNPVVLRIVERVPERLDERVDVLGARSARTVVVEDDLEPDPVRVADDRVEER